MASNLVRVLLAVCLVFAASTAAPGAESRTAPGDAFEFASRVAPILAKAAAPTVWESSFRDEASDFVLFLDSERVLIGSVEVGGYLGVPDYRKLLLVNASTGDLIWEADRRKLAPGGRYSVVSLSPQILVLGRSAEVFLLTAFDPANGSRVWESQIRSPLAHSVSPDNKRAYVVAGSGSRRQLHAVDTSDGRTVWTVGVPLDTCAKGTSLQISSDAKAVFVYGAKCLLSFSVVEGSHSWTAALAESSDSELRLATAGDGLAVWSSKWMSVIEAGTGRKRWEQSAEPSLIKTATIRDSQLMQVLGLDSANPRSWTNGSDRIRAIDLETGATRWSTEVGGTLVSSLSFEGGRVFFTLEQELVAVATGDGTVQFRALLPKLFQFSIPTEYDPHGQADVLRLSNDRLFVSRESAGLAAFSTVDGGFLWQQATYVGFYGQYPYSLPTRQQRLRASLIANKMPPPPGVRPQNGTLFGQLPEVRWQRQQEAQRLERMAREALARRDYPKFRYANQAQILNLRSQASQDRMDAWSNLASSVNDAAAQLSDAFKRTSIEALISRQGIEIDHAAAMHQNAFRGRYYVRPFQFEKGAIGLTLVDLESGLRHDLIVSPYIPAVAAINIDAPQFDIDEESGRLVTVGVGLYPARYEAYVMWRVRQPRPSILAYDTRAFDFASRSPVDVEVKALSLPTAQLQLFTGAQTGNLQRIIRTLEAGAEINAVDKSGKTAVMSAAEKGHAAAVQLLLQRGADATIEATGRTAFDFAKDHAAVREVLKRAIGAGTQSQ